MTSNGHDHDSGETDAAREDGLRVVPEGYDPQQVHELLAGYKAQMDRLEQVLGSVQAALGVTGEERVAGEDIAPPDGRALQLAADYRPSSLRFDPTPVSSRIVPGMPPAAMRPRARNAGLVQRLLLEAGFLVLVVLALAILQEPQRIVLAGAAAAWLVVILVEVLLARLQTRVVHAQLHPEPVAAPPVARPEVVALRLPHAPEPAPAPTAAPAAPEPVDAVTGPDDVWVVPQEVLIAEPVLDEQPEPDEEPAAPLLEDTMETDVETEEDVLLGLAEVDSEAELPPEPESESEPEPEPRPEPEPEVEPEPEPEPEAVAAAPDVEAEAEPEPIDETPLLPHDEDAPAVAEWPEEPFATDSWEPIFDTPRAVEANAARRWPFTRRAADIPAPHGPLTPPDPELARVTHPLPPVLIDPLADGHGAGKRRSRRRRA